LHGCTTRRGNGRKAAQDGIPSCTLGDLIHNLSAFLKKGKEEPSYRHIIRTNYRKFVVLIIVSTIPTAIIGFAGEKLIRDASATLIVPGICLLITGLLLFLSDRVENCWKIPKDVSWGEGILIGVAQGFATLPGLSRSGTTISACTFCGLDRKFAVKYSFILSIPAILGAALLEISDIGSETLTGAMIGSYAAGMIAAAVVGYISIRFLLRIVRGRKMRYFGYYCFAVGILAIAGHFFLK
jgi:undecaprenyl-diphosphatase